ncbi:MAG: redoxin domain-containing protein [Sphingomonadaceae bacterium]
MKSWLVPLAAASLAIAPAAASVATGEKVRDFLLNDADGKVAQLYDYRGRTVVLEWNNPDCPFVRKHYDSGNMQKTQEAARRAGAVWLTINSGAPGLQGHMTGAQAKKYVAAHDARPNRYLLDPKGVVGRAFDARTTPHIYIIDANGVLVYQGGIDDRPTADRADIAKARNHVLAALAELKAGKAVSVAETRPYGCSVKYSDG